MAANADGADAGQRLQARLDLVHFFTNWKHEYISAAGRKILGEERSSSIYD